METTFKTRKRRSKTKVNKQVIFVKNFKVKELSKNIMLRLRVKKFYKHLSRVLIVLGYVFILVAITSLLRNLIK